MGAFQPWTLPGLLEPGFDTAPYSGHIERAECGAFNDDEPGREFIERIDAPSERAAACYTFFSVYLALKCGGCACVADRSTEAEAEALAGEIAEAYGFRL